MKSCGRKRVAVESNDRWKMFFYLFSYFFPSCKKFVMNFQVMTNGLIATMTFDLPEHHLISPSLSPSER